MSVELDQWHKAESLESGIVFLECKDGKYSPLTEEDIMNLRVVNTNDYSLTPCFMI